MRGAIGSGVVMLSAGVVVGVVISGGFSGDGTPVAAAAGVKSTLSPSALPSVSPSIAADDTVSGAVDGSYDSAAATAARSAAARAASTDSGAVTFGGQDLPDLIVVPPSRTDGPLKLTVGLGDSITYRGGSWFRRVCGAGVLDTCRDAGVRGDTTTGMLERLDADVLALNPSVVTIMAGTNDLMYGLGQEQTIRNIDEMVTRVKDSGAKVVLCTIAPRNRTPQEALALNTAIRKYAKTSEVRLFDAYPTVGTAEGRFRKGLTDDGVHPNAAGMKLMADLAEQELPGLLAKKP